MGTNDQGARVSFCERQAAPFLPVWRDCADTGRYKREVAAGLLRELFRGVGFYPLG
jgi:hypothetical protein